MLIWEILKSHIAESVGEKQVDLKSLYKILTACQSGKIKLARKIDDRAYMLQKILNTKEGKEKYFIKPPKAKKPKRMIG